MILADVASDLGIRGGMLARMIRICIDLANDGVYPEAYNSHGAYVLDAYTCSVREVDDRSPKETPPGVLGIGPGRVVDVVLARKNIDKRVASLAHILKAYSSGYQLIGPPGIQTAVRPVRWFMGFVDHVAMSVSDAYLWIDVLMSLNPIQKVYLLPASDRRASCFALHGTVYPSWASRDLHGFTTWGKRSVLDSCSLRYFPVDMDLVSHGGIKPLEEEAVECVSACKFGSKLDAMLSFAGLLNSRWPGVSFQLREEK
jgi:hypothetical protein